MVGNILEKSCPKCGAKMAPAAVVCIDCGHDTRLGMNVKTVAAAKRTGRFGATVAAAAGASLAGAVAWAIIAATSGYKISLLAIGIGVVVGVIMATTTDRGARLRAGLVSAGLALGGIIVGNLLILHYVVMPKFTEGFINASTNAESVEHGVRWVVMCGYALTDDDERIGRSLLMAENDYNDDTDEYKELTRAQVNRLLKMPRDELEARYPDVGEATHALRAFDLYALIPADRAFQALGAMRTRLNRDLEENPALRESALEKIREEFRQGFTPNWSLWQQIKMTHGWFDLLCIAFAMYYAFRAAVGAEEKSAA